VIAIDASRTVVSARGARRHASAALQANAIHFGSDLLGSTAVLAGLLAARAGYPGGDSIAALFVAGLVVIAAGRLMRANVDVLMDRSSPEAEAVARRAIAGLEPPVELRRLRMRESAGRYFADVVICVPSGAAVGQGHAAADAVEAALYEALPRIDVVVHVEPADEASVRERAHAAALAVRRVREVHNVEVLSVDGRPEVSLHLKLPGDLPLHEAHAIATEVERAIASAVPEVEDVQTHVEPLAEASPAAGAAAGPAATIIAVVREETGASPRDVRVLETGRGLVAFLTLGLDAELPLAEAHARASQVEERIRERRPEIADVIVHTEP
jgi:divalent metal cation (Fe/Co/Zn/Cd) transporter